MYIYTHTHTLTKCFCWNKNKNNNLTRHRTKNLVSMFIDRNYKNIIKKKKLFDLKYCNGV